MALVLELAVGLLRVVHAVVPVPCVLALGGLTLPTDNVSEWVEILLQHRPDLCVLIHKFGALVGDQRSGVRRRTVRTLRYGRSRG